MTIRNDDEQNRTLDIPDFLEDFRPNTENSVNNNDTTSTSIDMNIFKMSDEELYDSPKEPVTPTFDSFEEDPPKKKKGNGGKIVLIIFMILFMATTAVAALYAYKQHKEIETLNSQLNQAQAQVKDIQAQLETKTQTVEELTKQIEEYNKIMNAPVYEVTDGPLTFRKGPNKEADETTYDGEDSAYDGDRFKVLEVVTDTSDPDYKYAKIDDEVYFCIGTQDEPWAKKIETE